MASLEVLILRHFFEIQGFLVRQCLPSSPTAVESLQIINPSAKKHDKQLPPILFSSDLVNVAKALVWLPSWHAQKITPIQIKNSSELMKFIDRKLAERKVPEEFEEAQSAKVVVVPSVPTEEPYRRQTIDLLKARGIDSMISFRSILLDLIARQDIRQPREGLQLLQILSNFDLLKTTQMELFSNTDERRK